MNPWPLGLFLAAAAGCAGPRELPRFDPPAESEAPAPAADAPASGEPFGAWTSASIRGPGSGELRRIDVVFHRDGRYLSVAEHEGMPKLVSGTWSLAGGILTIQRDDGGALRFACRRDAGALILTERDAELRLLPLRE